MPTTLYFAQETAFLKGAGTYPVAATNYANVTPTATVTTEGRMLPYKWRAVANLTMGTGTGTTAKVSRFGRFFSTPFAENYTYNHPTNAGSAIQYFLADWEDNLDANHCVEQCYIFVWRPSTGAVVGVIQPVQTLAPGSKEPTAASSIQATLGSYFSGTAGSINILKGDILVFEPFSTYTKGSTTARNVRFYYGGATDVIAENTVIATPASRVVFSVDLPLELPSGAVTLDGRYSALMELRGALLVSSLRSAARIAQARLVDSSPLNASLKAKASSNAALTTRLGFSANLKSISKIFSHIRQTHEMSATLLSRARAFATFPDVSVGESLTLYYSGAGEPNNPTLSIGGPKGESLCGCDFSVSPSAPGVSVLAVHNTLEGIHELVVDTVAREVRLVLTEGIQSYSASYTEGVSTVSVGSREAGFVVVQIDSVSATDCVLTVNSVQRLNTLFLNPSRSALEDGETVFRCLYLFNDTDQEVKNVTLSVHTDSEDEVGVATEFFSRVNTQNPAAQQWPKTSHYRALDPTGWGGIFFAEESLQAFAELSAHALPVIIATSPVEQASDGVSIQVPVALTDDHDPTGKLAGLTFGPTLSWSRIPPRRGVSFWVRKQTLPSVPVDETVKAVFTVNADF